MGYKIGITGELLSHEHFTGVEYYVDRLSRSLKKLADIELIIPSGAQVGKSIPTFKHTPPLLNLLKPLKINMISSVLNRSSDFNRYDLIHSPTVTAPFFFSPKKVKVVMTVHDVIPFLHPQWHPWKRKLYFKYILKYRLQQVDHIISVSHSTKHDLIKYLGVSSEKITVIHLGAPEYFKPQNKVQKGNYILGVGTFEPRKNFEGLIRSFSRLKRQYRIKEKLIIVGKQGWFLKDIANLQKEYGTDILFKGYVDENELVELYQLAKVFIYPSFYEGFGLPVIEAMACGCPVITSNHSSLPEVGGAAALYVNPEDTDQISRKIYQVLSDQNLQEEMTRKGIMQVSKFSWEKCAEKTVQVYKKVMSQ